jgi:hypothetical protein
VSISVTEFFKLGIVAEQVSSKDITSDLKTEVFYLVIGHHHRDIFCGFSQSLQENVGAVA